jgi:hypothetical protein
MERVVHAMLMTGKVFGGGVDPAIAEAPMKAQPRLGAGPLVTADHLGVPPRRRGALTGQSLASTSTAARRVVGGCRGRGGGDDRLRTHTIAFVLTYRGITVASALARWVWDSFPDPEATLSPGCTPAIDHGAASGETWSGVRQYQGQLVAVIAVDEPADASSGRHQRQTESSATLPVVAVAAGLRQVDVRLDAMRAHDREVSRDRLPAGPAWSSGSPLPWTACTPVSADFHAGSSGQRVS